MRTFACISLIAVLTPAVCAAASPQEAAAPDRVLSEIQVRAPVTKTWYMNPAALSEIRGTYALSNGRSLRLENMRGKLFADLNQRGLTELVPVAENTFVSKDRDIALEYKPIAFGEEIVLSYKVDALAAESPWVTVRIAANR